MSCCTIETNVNLSLAGGWRAWQEIDLLTPWLALPDVPPVGPTVFYRAVTIGGPLVRLTARREAGQLVIEWPESAGTCELLESTSLSTTAAWTPRTGSAQMIGDRYRLVIPIAGGGNKFYRLRCPP
jgi:hypothetical protein